MNNSNAKTGYPRAPGLPQVFLPGSGRLDSAFAKQVASIIAPQHILFSYNNIAVEILEESFSGELDKDNLAIGGYKLSELSPARAVTWLERFILPGIIVQKNGVDMFQPKSMSEACARRLLVSPDLLSRLPRIERILTLQFRYS
jgi:hypothetical protein